MLKPGLGYRRTLKSLNSFSSQFNIYSFKVDYQLVQINLDKLVARSRNDKHSSLDKIRSTQVVYVFYHER